MNSNARRADGRFRSTETPETEPVTGCPWCRAHKTTRQGRTPLDACHPRSDNGHGHDRSTFWGDCTGWHRPPSRHLNAICACGVTPADQEMKDGRRLCVVCADTEDDIGDALYGVGCIEPTRVE